MPAEHLLRVRNEPISSPSIARNGDINHDRRRSGVALARRLEPLQLVERLGKLPTEVGFVARRAVGDGGIWQEALTPQVVEVPRHLLGFGLQLQHLDPRMLEGGEEQIVRGRAVALGSRHRRDAPSDQADRPGLELEPGHVVRNNLGHREIFWVDILSSLCVLKVHID